MSATLVVGLVPATAWAEELPQQPDGAVVEEQQNDAEGGAVAPEVNPEETPETAPEDVPVVPEGDANGEGSNDSTVDGAEGTTEDADSEGANGEDGAVPEEDKAVPEEKPEQVPMMTLAEAEPVATDDVAMIGEDSYKTLAAAIAAVPEDGTETTITLTQEKVTADSQIEVTGNKNIIIDLAKNTLDITLDVSFLKIKNGASVTFQNGTITAKKYNINTPTGVICVEAKSSVMLDNVTVETTGAALYPNGNAATVSVTDSTIKGGAYAVATNAASDNNHNVQIKLKNSSFEALSAVFVNIPCTLEMQNCDVVGEMHGVVVRGGTATITGGTIAMNYKDDDAEEMAHYFDNKDWLDGNTVNLAALTMGNKHKISYQYATNVTLDGVTLSSEGKYADLFPAVYAWANADADKGVTFDQKNCTFNGAVIFGNGGNNISAPVVEMNGKKYSTLEQAVKEAKGGETITLLQDVTLTETIKTDKNLTINLNGKTITGKNVRALHVTDGTLKLTGEGTVETIGTVDPSSSVIRVGDNTVNNEPKLIIDKDVTINAPATYGVTVFGKSNQEATINGTIKADSMPALSGNGSSGLGSTNITIGSTAVLESEDSVAIYHPQKGTLNINGGTITGKGGIEAKAGTINISGDAKIEATGKPKHNANGNGPSTEGYAISVVNTSSGYEGNPKVNVESGKVVGDVAVVNDVDPTPDRKGDIEITGGTFSESVKEYVNDNFKFELQNGSGNDAEFTYYPTLDAAKEEAKEGAVITDVTVTPDAEKVTVTIKYHNGEEDTISEIVKGGKIYSLDTPTKSRYRFRGWTVGDSYISFPYEVEDSVTIEAAWKKKSSSSGSSSSSQEYKVTIADGIENGKVKVDPTKAEKGDKVTITVTPNKGYEINKVYAKDADGDKLELKDKGDGEYTFTMPDSKVEVKATFVKAEEEKPAEPEEIPAAEKIVLTVNERAAMVFGEAVVNDVAPIIRNDRTMLPIRFVAKNLGAEVTWDAQFQKVSITKDDLKIEIIIGSPVAFVNGENVTLDSPAFIENSRTYLPLRFVAENLGATVLWDAKAQEVTIVPEKAAETK